MIKSIPLNKLVQSPRNVRRHDDPAADAELKASIAAHGLLQNLIVRPASRGKFEVEAGERRRRAMLALADDKILPKDHEVTCLVLEDSADTAVETSLAENFHRLAMNPADEAQAFAALIDAGTSTDEVARHDATLGEISQAMEDAYGRYDTVPTPVRGVYSRAYAEDDRYAQVVEGVKAVERRRGRAPRLMVAKMGQDGHDRGANVIASAFADMGFDVVSGPLFQTPAENILRAEKAATVSKINAKQGDSLAVDEVILTLSNSEQTLGCLV